MAVIKLTINDRILEHVLSLLKQFQGKGLEIERLDEGFEEHKKHVQEQLKLMDSGKAEFITLDELDQKLQETIRAHED